MGSLGKASVGEVPVMGLQDCFGDSGSVHVAPGVGLETLYG